MNTTGVDLSRLGGKVALPDYCPYQQVCLTSYTIQAIYGHSLLSMLFFMDFVCLQSLYSTLLYSTLGI